MKKLIIIPAYNEEDSILSTIADIQENAPEFDYIVINDCSTDRTREICRENGVHFLDLPANLGIGGAVQTGYKYALEYGYEMVVQFDGDGQHDASFLEKMAVFLESQNLDMVIGSRFIKKEGFQSSMMRKVGIRYFTRLIRFLTGKTITDPTSGMRMIGKRLVKKFAKDYPKDYPEPESVALILKEGYRVEEIPVVMRERHGGVSSISPINSIYYMIKVTLALFLVVLRKKRRVEE